MRFAAALLVLALGACGDRAANTLNDGEGAGGQDPASCSALPCCAAGEVADDDGSCRPAGMTAEDCAPGFDFDGFACMPQLPPESCPDGTMALPGETACRPVDDCGDATWGHIVDDGATLFVDPTAFGGGKGGIADPYASLESALNAAAPGQTVALAEGDYGPVALDKRVRLVGRCSQRVGFVDGKSPALHVRAGAAGTVLEHLGLAGRLVVEGDLVARAVYLHDGAIAASAGGEAPVLSIVAPATVQLEDSLLENGAPAIKLTAPATLEMTRTVLKPRTPGGVWGAVGISSVTAPADAPTITLREVVIEDAVGAGIHVTNAALDAERLVIRHTERYSSQYWGQSYTIAHALSFGAYYKDVSFPLAIRDSAFIDGKGGVVVLGGDATITRTVFHRLVDIDKGGALTVQANPARIALSESVIREVDHVGIFLVDAEGTMRDVRIQDVAAVGGLFGDAIDVASYDRGAHLDLQGVWIDNVARGGVVVHAASAQMASTRIECAAISLNVEHEFTIEALHYEGPGVIIDGGGNRCGCMGEQICSVLSSDLQPPPAIPFPAEP